MIQHSFQHWVNFDNAAPILLERMKQSCIPMCFFLFFLCRRGWEWQDKQWNTCTRDNAGWARYKSYPILHYDCQKCFDSLDHLNFNYKIYVCPCLFQVTTTESPDATENNNGGLVSFKQWVSETAPGGTEAAGHLVYETQDACFEHYTNQSLRLSCPVTCAGWSRETNIQLCVSIDQSLFNMCTLCSSEY